MKSIKVAVLLVVVCLLSACENKTPYGPCVGAFDEKKPNLVYKLSVNNVVWGLLGSELLFIPPVIVVANETFCPVGVKPEPQPPMKAE